LKPLPSCNYWYSLQWAMVTGYKSYQNSLNLNQPTGIKTTMEIDRAGIKTCENVTTCAITHIEVEGILVAFVTCNIIRSSIMSHITFKMCQFELIIYLRDYHYDFYLDIFVSWSFYGVLRLTYTTYQNLCPTDHFFGRLLMSQDISPTWMVLLESTYRIIQKCFHIFPMSNIVLFPMYVSYRF